jgi:hypothetical protein
LQLPAGRYLVVPTTSGCKFQQSAPPAAKAQQAGGGGEGERVPVLTTASKKAAAAAAVAAAAAAAAGGAKGSAAAAAAAAGSEPWRLLQFTEAAEAAIKEMHRRIDLDMDGLLNRAELCDFLQLAEGGAPGGGSANKVTDAVYRWLLATFDSRAHGTNGGGGGGGGGAAARAAAAAVSGAGGLTPDGLVEAYKFMFEQGGNTEATVWRDLLFMGYDERLNLVNARVGVVSLHSEKPTTLKQLPLFDMAAYEAALELPIRRNGSQSAASKDGHLQLYTLRSGYSGVSLAVENTGPAAVVATVDCSRASNCVSHRGELKAREVLAPGQFKVMHHLMPASSGPWTLKTGVSSQPVSAAAGGAGAGSGGGR